jgi:RHS repeat-associated protein
LPGQLYDPETGFHYNYHRYYDPRTGRYLTPDPIGLAGGINLYAYVGNNPVNATDPYGLAEALLPFAIAIAPGIAMLDSPVLPFADAGAGALIGVAWLLDHFPHERNFLETGNACDAGQKKILFKWDQKSQRWKEVGTGRYVSGPKMPKGFGKPSSWREGSKDVSQDTRKLKAAKEIYEKLKASSEADDLTSAIEAALKYRR